jgi:Fic family protein
MKPYLPGPLPPAFIHWESLITLIGKANAAVARYDGLLHSVVNPVILLAPLTLREAVLSSQIEGTQATLSEVLQHEAGVRFESQKEYDIQEIINYRNALEIAVQRLKKRPLSLNLVKELHAVLMQSVRGHNKAPGEFRRVQNWIGRPGAGIEQATFVPPSPDVLLEALGTWESYIHADEKDLLVQLAIVHAQFEIIHPFLDGNGRVGRLLIPIFLAEKGILAQPLFYLSAYFEAHRDQYYDRLRAITAESNWQGWIEFFLKAVFEQANESSQRVMSIQALYERMKAELPETIGAQFVLAALDALFKKPVLSSTDFIQSTQIARRSALRVLSALKEAGFLSTLKPAAGNRPEVLIFKQLVQAAEGGEAE